MLNQQPAIPATQNLPEITCKAVILAIFLTIILAAANAYLALKVGATVSGSIPAAIISMGILRLFKHSNLLENNIVQTAASSGETLTAGVVFIIPALLILKFWTQFSYWHIAIIAILGGIIGVLFSVPLRRVLLNDPSLPYPEGTAIGMVLKASATTSLHGLVYGGLVGACIRFAQSGLKIFSDSFQSWTYAFGTVFGYGLGFSPALIAAGYIVGIRVAMSFLCGILIGWIVGIPILAWQHGIPHAISAQNFALSLWNNQSRYIGIGTMLVGGLWTLIKLCKPIAIGLQASFASLKKQSSHTIQIPRTEKDIPIHYVLIATAVLSVCLYFLFNHLILTDFPNISVQHSLPLTLFGIGFVLIIGFIIASICGYFAGLVGSTNSPLSGMILIALMLVSLLIMLLLSFLSYQNTASTNLPPEAVFAVMVTAVIAAIGSISNDTLQDLKAGQIVGATPWKQQIMLILGVVIAALTIPLILELLFNAYGIGGIYPHPGMDPSQNLTAPQAGLMAAIVKGIFQHNLNWNTISIGGIVALVFIFIDEFLQKRTGKGLPVLAVGLGIYLPTSASVPMVFGGLASFYINKFIIKGRSENVGLEHAKQQTLMLACGIVAGAALTGVLLAFPFVIAGSSDVLSIVPKHFIPIANFLGILSAVLLCWWLISTFKKHYAYRP